MTVLSKLTNTPYGYRPFASRRIKPYLNTVFPIRSGGHGHIFIKRQGQLIGNRMKDVFHFYFVGLGVLPYMAILVYNHCKFGPCELTDYPEDGPPPHYWQFERTPIQQFMSKSFCESDMEHLERQLCWFERNMILARWRRAEHRVKHLMHERWDYKGYYYEPVTAAWIDQTRLNHVRAHTQNDEHSEFTG